MNWDMHVELPNVCARAARKCKATKMQGRVPLPPPPPAQLRKDWRLLAALLRWRSTAVALLLTRPRACLLKAILRWRATAVAFFSHGHVHLGGTKELDDRRGDPLGILEDGEVAQALQRLEGDARRA